MNNLWAGIINLLGLPALFVFALWLALTHLHFEEFFKGKQKMLGTIFFVRFIFIAIVFVILWISFFDARKSPQPSSSNKIQPKTSAIK